MWNSKYIQWLSPVGSLSKSDGELSFYILMIIRRCLNEVIHFFIYNFDINVNYFLSSIFTSCEI